MADLSYIIGSTFFPARTHAERLDEIGKEIDQVRAAMRLLGEGPPDDPIRRAGNMLAAISAAHFDEAARLRRPEPERIAVNASVKRRQRLLLAVMTAVVLLMSLAWISSDNDHYSDHRTSDVTVDDSWDRGKAEQEWIAQSRNRYGRDDAQ